METVPPMVSPFTQGYGTITSLAVAGGAVSGAWPSANQGIWLPVWLPSVGIARRLWWVNGATVSATYNVEVGIYRDDGHKPGAKLITTGSVAQGTASQVQLADITDTALTCGLWWLFMSCSSASATFFRSSFGGAYADIAGFDQASIGPGSAPDPAVPTELGTVASAFIFGFSTTTIT